MKKQLLLLPALAMVFGAYASKPTMTLGGKELTIDTLFHAKVGPGTTQTQLHFSGETPLDVFYLTVDLTTPGVSMRGVCAGHKLAGTARTSKMAEEASVGDTLFFAGTNADFFWTSGKATDGSSQVGTPIAATIVDNEVYKSGNSNYQFSVDAEGVARICRLNFYGGMATSGDKSAEFHGINVEAPANSLTLYTPRAWNSTCQVEFAGNCAEVTAKLVEGDKFESGRSYRIEVTGTPTSTGDTKIPDDGFVLFGRGSKAGNGTMGAKEFVESLKPGDIVMIDNVITTPEGERIYPVTAVSGNPKNIGGGANLNSEAERGDAKDRHPRTGIGVSQDGTKIIMLVVDGRGVSVGVSTGMLADIMLWAGAYEGVNLDGGGSSTLYTQALGVRNRTSDGQERSVGNSIFAVIDHGANDKTVAELQFMDWRFDSPHMGIYTPRVFAFNAAGIMIDNDFKDYTLSCPETLGEILDGGKSFFASGSGNGVLTASFGEAKATIPVYITETEAYSRVETVIVDGYNSYPIELEAKVLDNYVAVSPIAYSWSSSDVSVATVDDKGVVDGLSDGTAEITGTLGDKEARFTARVEIPTASAMPISSDVSAWTAKKSSMASLTATPQGSSLSLDYTMNATNRGAKITLTNKTEIYSRPDAVQVRLENMSSVPSSMSMTIKARNAAKAVVVNSKDLSSEGTSMTWKVDLGDVFDVTDVAIYPVEISSVSLTPTDAGKATGHIDVAGIEGIYSSVPSGIEETTVGAARNDSDTRWFDLRGVEVAPENLVPGIYIHGGKTVYVK